MFFIFLRNKVQGLGLYLFEFQGYKLDFIPPEIGESSLSSLFVQHNSLKILPVQLSEMVRLTTFCAHHNVIKKIPPEICEIKSLERLELNDNEIGILPVNFDNLKGLSVLQLENNPLQLPPSAVCESGVMQPIGRFIERATELEGKTNIIEELYIFFL